MRTHYYYYKQMTSRKHTNIKSSTVYKLLTSQGKFGRLLRFTHFFMEKHPQIIINVNNLFRYFKDSSLKNVHALKYSEQVQFVKCLNFWGHTVKVQPLSADFGYSYNCNMAIWRLKSKDYSEQKINRLCAKLNVEQSFFQSAVRQPYICPPHLLGLNSSSCIIYGSAISKPRQPSNMYWKNTNQKEINACLGPKIVHNASRYYWQRLRDYVKCRNIFWYWLQLIVQKNCMNDGKYRKIDLEEYINFVSTM